jgi:hypothetical protein
MIVSNNMRGMCTFVCGPFLQDPYEKHSTKLDSELKFSNASERECKVE